MPPLAVAAVAAGVAAAAGAALTTIALVATVAMSLTTLLTMKVKSPGGYVSQQERKQVLRATAAAKVLVFGTTKGSGLLSFAEEEAGDQADGEWMHMVLTVAGHELSSVGQIYLGDDTIETYGAAVSYEVINNPTTVNQFLLNNCPSWKDDMIGKGICYLRLSLKFDSDLFPSGLPNVTMIKNGAKVYDPRTQTVYFSRNAALCYLHYLINYAKVPLENIIIEEFIEAANICDENVLNADGSTSKRYTCDGEINLDEKQSDVLEKLLQCCGGEPTFRGGKHGILVGAYYGPATLVLDESMIVGDVKIVPESSYKEKVNSATGTYINIEQGYVESDFPKIIIDEWLTEDGKPFEDDFKLRFVTNAYTAQRLAMITIKRKRQGRTLEVPCNFKAYGMRPGKNILVNIPTIGMINQEYKVIKWGFDANGGMSLTLRLDFAEMYDDVVGKVVETPPTIDLNNGKPFQPKNLAYTVSEIGEVVQGVLSWENIGEFTYNQVLIKQGGVLVSSGQAPLSSTRLNGLKRGTYTAHVIAVNSIGAKSAEAFLEFTINAPQMPLSVEITSGYYSITLNPIGGAGGTVSTQYEFWTSGTTKLASTNTAFVEANANRRGIANSWTENDLILETSYWWYIRAVNVYGTSEFLEVEAICDTDISKILDELEIDFDNIPAVQEIQKQQLQQIKDSLQNSLAIIKNNYGDLAETRRLVFENGERKASIVETWVAIANESEARAAAILELNAQINDEIGVQVKQLTEALSTLEENTGQSITQINAQMGNIQGQTDANSTAISGLQSTVSNQAGVITSHGLQITSLESSVTNVQNQSNANSTALSSLETTVTSQGNTLTSQGTQITGLTATVNGHTSSINSISQVTTDLSGKVSAMYSVQITTQGANQYIGGFLLGGDGTGITASWLVDNFKIATGTSGAPVNVFQVEGSQVQLRAAIIGDATIGFAKIKDDIRSSATGVGGKPLWTLNKSGSLIMVGEDEGSGHLEIQGNKIEFFDTNNVRRILLGSD